MGWSQVQTLKKNPKTIVYHAFLHAKHINVTSASASYQVTVCTTASAYIYCTCICAYLSRCVMQMTPSLKYLMRPGGAVY